MSKNSTYDIFAQSFFNLTIFRPCLTKMMSACKARAPDEGGMMKTCQLKVDIFDNFCYVLFVVNEIVILSENSIPERSGTTPGQEMR